jgi:hypothetical protein
MQPNPHEPGNITAVAIEMGPGWMFFKVADPKPPSRIEFFLRRAIEDWLAEHPTFAISKAMAITDHGETLGIHVWYDRTDAAAKPAKPASPIEIGIDIHRQITAAHSREYIEAVVADALRILPSYLERRDTLVVINPRRVAVILDTQANRGAVIPAAFIEEVAEGATKERLQAWLRSPPTPFYVMHIGGSWFSPKA